MKKKILTIVLGIFLLVSVSALYAGTCQEVELNFDSYDNVSYVVVGNSSNMEGLNVFLNETTANICPVINFKPDNFTIIFVENKDNEVIKEVYVSSGGGIRTNTVYENITEYVQVETIRYIERENKTTSEQICEDLGTCPIDDDEEPIKIDNGNKLFTRIILSVIAFILITYFLILVNILYKNYKKIKIIKRGKMIKENLELRRDNIVNYIVALMIVILAYFIMRSFF